MSKQANRLTAKKIERLKKPGRYHDGFGLVLQITKSGSRSWILRYQRHGRERMLGLGPLHTVTLKEARERAKKARLQLLDGEDPIQARREKRIQTRLEAARQANLVTFRAAAERFLAAHEGAWKNAVHREQWRKTLTTYAYPIIGSLPVQAIDTDWVLQVLEPIWTSRQQTAMRLRGRIERILDWAKARGLRDGENPARWRAHLDKLVQKPTTKAKHFAAMPYEEVPNFVAELRAREGVAARALEVTILTAARTGEVVGAKWTEIDLAKKLWIVPAERMKSEREHRIPLSPRVMELLADLPREDGNDSVFIGNRAGAPINKTALYTTLQAIRRGSGLTVHGFRSAFRDWCAERTNFPREIAEEALAHVIGDATERAYRRGDVLEKRRQLMTAWAKFCSRSLPAGEVVPLSPASTAQ
jgi:integrase